jgi:uncharacterized protein YndB with AHSA1/START domain
MNLPHELERTITIDAPPEAVFGFFTDNARWASWWGAGSTIEARPGGRVYIRHPGNVEVSGEVLEITPSTRVVFSYGYASGSPFPAGASQVTIVLEPDGAGTRLHLTHAFPDAASRDEHVQGWRYQLSLFSNAVLNIVHAGAADTVDAWFRLWAEKNPATRATAIGALAVPAVVFRDRYSLTQGADDLSAHIGATQQFMPGLSLERRGPVRHCQGTVLADWAAVGPDGSERGSGSNVFVMAADGRVAAVTGFWG